MLLAIRHCLLIVILSLLGHVTLMAQTPAELQACLDGTASVCTVGTVGSPENWLFAILDFEKKQESNPHWICNEPSRSPWCGFHYQVLKVNRGGVTITSVDGNPQNFFASNAIDWEHPLMEINFQGTQGVAIRNIRFHNYHENYPSVRPLLKITRAELSGNWPANPFLSAGPYSVEVDDCQFYYGQGGSQAPSAGVVVMNLHGLTRANDIYIHHSYFEYSTVGFFTGLDDPYALPSGQFGVGCDTLANYRDSTASYTPRNIRIEYNTFKNVGQGALSLNNTRWVGIRYNTLMNDWAVHNSGTDQGGAIFADQCSDTVDIIGNSLWGPGAGLDANAQMAGLELLGRSATVSGNVIRDFYLDGISAQNVYNLTISGNQIYGNNTSGYPSGGIKIRNILSVGYPDYSRRTNGITISSNDLGNLGVKRQKYGIRMDYHSPQPIPLNIQIHPNNLYYGVGNDFGPACYYNWPPSPYLPLTPNPQNVSTPGNSIAWVACQ
ncbi:MAG: right-handed parallel beta-helix repeat-containing protein [Bryobacteraceae bacterium]|nr:right-handed parallel beta-helix repeat-containing protein [Solibacteraceae bacterium]MCO5349622.1 right-handed parallel beta-helix repeat-containing protein [Bryobacteraceae bacterium]